MTASPSIDSTTMSPHHEEHTQERLEYSYGLSLLWLGNAICPLIEDLFFLRKPCGARAKIFSPVEIFTTRLFLSILNLLPMAYLNESHTLGLATSAKVRGGMRIDLGGSRVPGNLQGVPRAAARG